MRAADPAQQAVLDERARALARPVARPRAGATLSLVSFALAGETYAIEARYVPGVFRLIELAPLPGAAPPAVGVTAWRGRLVSVVDLRLLLGLPAAGLDDRAWIVAVGEETPAFGLLAGAVRDVTDVGAEDVGLPREGMVAPRQFIRGVTREAVLVLDAARLLELRG